MPKAYHNYSFFIIHHSLFIKIKKRHLTHRGAFRAVPPCFAEVTASCLLCIGSTRPDLSGRTKVARSLPDPRAPTVPSRSSAARLLLFRIALQYLEYFNMNFGIVNWFFEFSLLFCRAGGMPPPTTCDNCPPIYRSTGPKTPRHCEERSDVAIRSLPAPAGPGSASHYRGYGLPRPAASQ